MRVETDTDFTIMPMLRSLIHALIRPDTRGATAPGARGGIEAECLDPLEPSLGLLVAVLREASPRLRFVHGIHG